MRRHVHLQTVVKADRSEHGAYLAGVIIDDTQAEEAHDMIYPRAIPAIAGYPGHRVPTEPTGDVLAEERVAFGEPPVKWYRAADSLPTMQQAAERAASVATGLIRDSMTLAKAKESVRQQVRDLQAEAEQLASTWPAEQTVTSQD